MFRTWSARIVIAAGAVGLLISGLAAAGDDADDKPTSPLGRIMKKMDEQTKAIQKATSTRLIFKKADTKKLVASSEDLVAFGKKTRDFKEPAKEMKQPYDKWVDMTERYIAAAQEIGKMAEKKDFPGMAKARSALIQTCSNCHGAFRPAVDDGF